MVDRGRKARANRDAHQEAKDPERYDMRCVQCSNMHKLCNRVKPCSNCVGGGRTATCRFPEKANRTTVEHKGRTTVKKREEVEEEEEEEEEEDDEFEVGARNLSYVYLIEIFASGSDHSSVLPKGGHAVACALLSYFVFIKGVTTRSSRSKIFAFVKVTPNIFDHLRRSKVHDRQFGARVHILESRHISSVF